MNEYIELIEKLAKDQKNEVFYNSGEDHALVVLKNIFRHADRYVDTLCGNLCSEMCEDKEYLELVDNFLSENPSRNLNILFDNYDDKFLQKGIYRILSKYPKQVKVRKLNNIRIKYEGTPIHLTVSDDKSFRLETDIENKKAWGNFNDEEKARIFREGFELFFNDDYSTSVLN